MYIQKQPFTPTYTCHQCGYDMHDRAAGEPCPECNMALDLRSDMPGSEKLSSIRIGILFGAVLVMPFVALISFVGVFVALYPCYPKKELECDFRITPRGVTLHRLIRTLFRVCIAEFAVFTLISLIWPDALNWW